MKKLIDKTLSLVMSIAMVLTLTPSVAFATGTGGGYQSMTNVGNDESVYFDSYGPSEGYNVDRQLFLGASTTVHGMAIDMDLGFTDRAFDKNFDSAADAISETTPAPDGTGTAPDSNNPKPSDGPLWAEFNGGSGEFDITWTIYDAVFQDGEYVKQPHTYNTAIAGNTNPITGQRYDAPFTTHADDRNVDKDDKLNYFYLSITDYDNLEDKHFYIYEIKLWDRDREKEFTTEIMVSTYEGYSYDRYYAWDDTHCATFVEGNVYKQPPDTVAMLVDDYLELTDPAYMEMITAAADQATPTNITVPQALYLSNLDGRPAGAAAYIMGLKVHLDLSQAEVAHYQEGDIVTVYRYNPDKNRVDVLEGRVVIAVDEKDQPLLKDGTVYDPTTQPGGNTSAPGNTGGTNAADPGNTGTNTGSGTTTPEPPAPDYLLSVEVTVYGESANLGAFAIGYETDGVYGIKSEAGEGGSISPLGTYPFTEECTPTYLIYPEEGYEIDNVEITLNGVTQRLDPNGLVGNVLTIDNDFYGFVNNDYVTITVTFKKVTPQYPSYNVKVELTSDDPDATGYLNFSSPIDGEKNRVEMWDTSNATTMSSEAGVLFEFSPGAGYKVDTLDVNGTIYKVPGTSYYVPNLTANMNVVVTYTKGWDINPVSRKMTVSVDNPAGKQTGHVFDAYGNSTDANGDPLSETVLRVPFGDVATASSGPEEDYMLDYVTLYIGDSPDGTDITDRVMANEDLDNLVLSVYNVQVYNVITDIRVVYTYKHVDTRLTVTNANVDRGDVTPTGTFPMADGDSLLIKITPDQANGYTLGSVLMDGVSISNYLTERNGGEYYTLKVVKSDTIDPADGNNPDGTVDKVLYINEAKSEIVVSFDSKILNPSAYLNISTTVAGIGGGSITPTQAVEPDSNATVWLFPDQGYTVQSVTVDGTAISVNGPNPTGVTKVTADNTGCIIRIDFENIQTDHDVVVRYTPGNSEASGWDKYLIKPTATGGGFVSPSVDTWAYKGTEQTFRFFPMTGYDLSEVYIDGSTTPVDKGNDPAFHGTSYVFSNIEADHQIHATFAKTSDLTNGEKTYNLTINAGPNGTASPTGTFIVASGSCMSVAIMPDNGYMIDKVNVRNSATAAGSSGINLAGTVSNGTFTLFDIKDDTEVDITFKQGTDPDYPSTDPSDLIILKAHNSKVDAGAVMEPQTEGLTFFKEPGTNHASVDGNFTVMVYGSNTLEGIYVNGEPLKYRDLGDGVYAFTVDKEKITQQVLIEVRTHLDTPSTPNVDLKKIFLTVEGAGSISPSGIDNVVNVENGKSQTFYFIPADSNHKLEAVYINDNLVSVNKYSYTIASVVSNMYVKAVFTEGTPVPPVGATHTVNIIPRSSSGDGIMHGSTTVTTATVTDGGSLSATFVPDAGYEAYLVDDDTGDCLTGQTGQPTQLSGNTFQLRNITSDRNFTLEFVPIKSASTYHVITASSSDGGRISPEGSITVIDGETFTFTLLPESGNTFQDVWINGVNHPEMVKNDMTLTLSNITEDMDVWVSFDRGTPPSTPTTFELTAETTAGGIVSPTEVTAASGITVPFTFIAQKGYTLTKVEVDGVAVPQSAYEAGVYRAVANGNHHIVGTFTKGGGVEDTGTHYSIFADCTKGGTISPIGRVSVPYGGNMSFTLMPDLGWKVKSISITQGSNSQSVVDPFHGSSYTLFNVTADTVFYVTFVELDPGEVQYIPNTFDITATSSANGSISPAGVTTVAEGSSAYFTFVPREGFKLSYIVVDGLNIPASSITRGQYAFTNVKEAHTIHAVYIEESLSAADFATINVSDPANGSITPSGNVLVEKGSDASFRIAPYFGYKLTGIVYNGRTLSATDYVDTVDFKWDGTTFTIKNVQQDCSLSATFEETTPNIQDRTPEYTKVTMIGNAPGCGGATSFGPGTTVIEALLPNEFLDISFIPDEGNAIKKLKVTYSDGTVKEYTEAELEDVWEQGYVRFTPTQVNGEPGITIEVAFGEMTPDQKKKVEDGEIIPAGFHIIQASWKGSGSVNPAGTLKIANGATARFSMIPQSGYELSSLLIDDEESLHQLEKNSRSYTFVGNDSHTLMAVFGVTTSIETTYKVTAKVQNNTGGRVSPAEAIVASGEAASVHFFPDTAGNGYKLVGFYQNGAYTKYTTPSYVISHVTEDIEIIAVFEELEPGENTWKVEPITINARAVGEDGAQAQGSVSPTSVEVPLGSTQRFSFNPNPGYEVDYIVFNNTIIRFTSSPTTYIATPVKLNNGDPNTLDVHFRSIEMKSAEITVTADVHVNVSGGNSSGSGSVSPTSRTVPYGDPATFYIFPDPGYTVEKVLLDGQPQPYTGLRTADSTTSNFTHGWTFGVSAASEEGAALADLYAGGAITSTALYRGDAGLFAAAGVPTYYSSYMTTIPSVTHDATLEVYFRTIDDSHFTYVDTKSHRLTISSEGGGTVSPLGSGLRAEGAIETIATNAFSGYYLESITVRQYDESGNLVSEQDMTDRLNGKLFQYLMGKYDTDIHVKYTLIGTPSYVHVGISSATNTEGDDLTVNVSPSLVTPDGHPVDFVRGETYSFFFSTEETGPNGRPYVIESITYNGIPVPFIEGSNYVTLPLDASGSFDIVFRELREDEVMIEPDTFRVTAEVVGGQGSVTPESQPVIPGNPASVAFEGATDLWIVDKVVDYYAEQEGGEVIAHEISSNEYPEGVYTIPNVLTDHRIEVSFVEAVRIQVNWNHDHGFITPNTGYDEYLLVDKNTSQTFVVAPYVNYEVQKVTMDTDLMSDDMTGFLRQSKKTTQYLTNLTGADVILTEEGMGVAGLMSVPNPEEVANTQSVATTAANNKNVGVDPLGAPFSRAYEFSTYKLTEPMNYLNASFVTDRIEDKTFEIKASVIGDYGGTVEPTLAHVNGGGSFTFTFHPNAGCQVVGIRINGGQFIEYRGNSYTFNNVTSDMTLEVGFDSITAPGSNRALRTLRAIGDLTQTGDMNGPMIAMLLTLAGIALLMAFIVFLRHKKRDEDEDENVPPTPPMSGPPARPSIRA